MLFSDRLEKVRQHYELSKTDFAKRCNIDLSRLYGYTKGGQKPNMKFFSSFGEAFTEIDFNWFVIGKGEMFKTNNQRDNQNTNDEKKTQLTENIAEALHKLQGTKYEVQITIKT